MTLTNDTLMNVWALRELTNQLVSDPLNLLDGNAFHPYTENSLALVDHMLANALLVAPLWLLTGHSLLIYNVAVMATFALTGFFTYKLVVRLCDSQVAGLVAGVAFAFSSIRWQQVTHLHAASTQWLPLALLALHSLLEQPTRRRLSAFTGAAVLVALSSWHVALFGVFSIGTIALWTMAGDSAPVGRRLWMLAAAALVVFACLIPMALDYVDAARAWRRVYSAPDRAHELQSHSLSVEGLVAPGHEVRTGYAPTLAQFGDGEWRGFPGAVTVTLALLALLTLRTTKPASRVSRALLAALAAGSGLLMIAVILALRGEPALADALAPWAPILLLSGALLAAGVWGARRAGRSSPDEDPGGARRRLITLAYSAVVVLGALLSLGPTIQAAGINLGSGIYREDWLPILSILRSPGRFVILVALGASVLAGLGARLVAERLPAQVSGVVLAVVLVLLNLDLRVAPLELVTAPRANRAVHGWLARSDEPGPVIEYPLARSLWWMYLSPAHGRPIVNGSGYVRPTMFDALTRPPDLSREQLEILWEYFHPRFAIVRGGLYGHKPGAFDALLAAAAAQPAAVRQRATFGRDVIFELTDNGSGPSLFRRWPREVLDEAGALTFTGSVSGAAAGTRTVLEVALNGRRLLRIEGTAAEQPALRTAAYDSDWLIPGINTFEIRGDYRLTADTPARPVGKTGASVRADVVIASTRTRSWMQVNGRRLSGDKGYTLAVLDAQTGDVLSQDRFNTSWYPEESARLARFIAAIPAGAPVAVASEFDVSRSLTVEAVSALSDLGLAGDLRGRAGVLHAAIGIKGARAGSALESVQEDSATVTIGNPHIRTVALAGLDLYLR